MKPHRRGKTMAKFNLENNPLFNSQEAEQIKATQPKPIGAGRPKNADADDFQRMTFIVRKEYLKKLRDYAYTERIDVKEALDQALEKFLKNKKDLLEAPDKKGGK